MPTFYNDGYMDALFMFNHIIAWFKVPKKIVTNHGSHLENTIMTELSTTLGFKQEHSCPYYPKTNGQLEEFN